MEEIIWTIQQRSRTLQDYRQDITNSWDDRASRKLNLRYLNPHEDDNQEMLIGLKKQRQELEKADTKIIKSQEFAAEVEKFSQKVDYFLQIEKQEEIQAYHFYHLSLDYRAKTQSRIPIVEQLIDRANLAGS